MDEDGERSAGGAARLPRVALVVAAMALGLSILRLFLPIGREAR